MENDKVLKAKRNNHLFVVERNEGEFSFKKNIRWLFLDIFIQIKEKDFYNRIFENYRKRKHFSLVPSVEGLTLSQYLCLKEKYLKNNGLSDFGKRVFYNLKNIEIKNLKQVMQSNGIPIYVGTLEGNITIKDNDGNLILMLNDFSTSFAETFEPSIKYYEWLFSCSSSGIYQTSRDTEELCKEIKRINPKLDMSWVCDICGEKCDDLNSFFSHLIEEKHYDSTLDIYKYDKECINIKKILNKIN